jgi:DNA-binding transcriptional LysR family regulator
MDLGSLEMFLAVARFGSINQAASALFLAQSTVTHRIRQLEKEVGTSLFVRTSSGVNLTAAGRRLLPIATSMMEQWHAFQKQNDESFNLSIVAGKAFASYELPRLLGAYSRLHPGFSCYVRSVLYEESITSLLTGTADIAFLGHEVYHPELQQIFLPNDRILLVVAPEHPWAVRFPGFDQWDNQAMITFGNKTVPFRQRVDRFLAENGVYPPVIMELDSFHAVKKMVAQNLGVSMLPERTIQDERNTGVLVAHDIAHGSLIRPTLIAYPHHKKADTRFLRFVDWIVKHYGSSASKT